MLYDLSSLIFFAHKSAALVFVMSLFFLVSFTTRKYRELKIRQSLLVAFFLAGLIVFGPMQKWWLEPFIVGVSEPILYHGSVILTAVTDNAALTYLGAQVSGLSELSKWALGGGAIVGGGMTILANAPNPAGFSILSSYFPDSTLNAFRLFKAALRPTLIALMLFYINIFIFN